MIKSIMLAGAAMISAPVLAQDMGTTDAAPATTQEAPAQTTADPSATTGTQATPDTQAAPQSSGSPQSSTSPQAATGDQIAQIVEAEFPTYDKDSSTDLNKDEFGAWMVALRSASEPGVDAKSAEVQTWTGQAFASADADKSGAVTKTELTSFLGKGAAS